MKLLEMYRRWRMTRTMVKLWRQSGGNTIRYRFLMPTGSRVEFSAPCDSLPQLAQVVRDFAAMLDAVQRKPEGK